MIGEWRTSGCGSGWHEQIRARHPEARVGRRAWWYGSGHGPSDASELAVRYRRGPYQLQMCVCYADLGIVQSIFSPAARPYESAETRETSWPRRWAKNGLD